MTVHTTELDNDKGHIGLRIQVLRKIAGLTQERLSKKSGVAYTTLTKIECGAIANPTYKTIIAISEALGAPMGVLTKSHNLIEGFDYTRHLLKDSGDKEMFVVTSTNRKEFHKKDLKDIVASHKKKLRKMGVKRKSLTQEGDTDFILPNKDSLYRWVPQKVLSQDITMSVYGDYLAITSLNHNIKIKWKNPMLADVYKKQFFFMWDAAKRIPDKELQKKIRI